MKRELYWIGMLTLFWVAISVVPALLGWQIMEGFSGLVIQFFLGYCAIILVAQVFSALVALRSVLDLLAKRRKVSRRVMLR